MHPLVNLKVPKRAVAVHWFEQSSFALKDSKGTIVQIDPYFPRNRPSDRFFHTEPPLDESELPTNFVLLTHAHGDHTCPESIRRIWDTSSATRFIGPEESVRQISSETDVDANNVSEFVRENLQNKRFYRCMLSMRNRLLETHQLTLRRPMLRIWGMLLPVMA